MVSSSPFPPLEEMPLLPITSQQTVAACQALDVTDNDIFVCSYPKSGTTWTQNLVCRLLAANVGMSFEGNWHLSHSAPFYEVDQYWKGNDRIPPKTPIQGKGKSYRVFNTHLRPHQLPPNAKCIYVVRDSLDVLTSFYYHLANQLKIDQGKYTGTPEQFCSDFVNGTILYGKWQDHLEDWLGKSDSKRKIHVMQYADMKKDLIKEATRLAIFLGVDEPRIVETNVVPHCTFSAMRAERWRYTPVSVEWENDERTGKPYDNFVRTGRIGDGSAFREQHFSENLKKQWQNDLVLARARCLYAGVDDQLIQRYLGS